MLKLSLLHLFVLISLIFPFSALADALPIPQLTYQTKGLETTFSWNKVEGAGYYELYYKKLPSGNPNFVMIRDSTSVTLSPGVHNDWGEGKFEVSLSAYSQDEENFSHGDKITIEIQRAVSSGTLLKGIRDIFDCNLVVRKDTKDTSGTNIICDLGLALSRVGEVKDFTSLGDLLSRAMNLVFLTAAFLAFGYMLYGVVQYIFAGGQKEQLAKARAKITYAIIGFIIILLSFAVSQYIQEVLQPGNTLLTPFSGTIGTLIQKGPGIFPTISTDTNEYVSLSDFYSSSNNPNSFAADCSTQRCKAVLAKMSQYKIPYIYDQTKVVVQEAYLAPIPGQPPAERPYNETWGCIKEGKEYSVEGSACGPTAMAMVAEAFNGHDNRNPGNPQTANDMARKFLVFGLMDCKFGINNPKVVDFSNNPISEDTLALDIERWVRGSFADLQNYFYAKGYPVWTSTYTQKFRDQRYTHYVAVAGISDNFVWVADPYKPVGQYIYKVPKKKFETNYYHWHYEISPNFISFNPGEN